MIQFDIFKRSQTLLLQTFLSPFPSSECSQGWSGAWGMSVLPLNLHEGNKCVVNRAL